MDEELLFACLDFLEDTDLAKLLEVDGGGLAFG